jgi:hypothetical protein
MQAVSFQRGIPPGVVGSPCALTSFHCCESRHLWVSDTNWRMSTGGVRRRLSCASLHVSTKSVN